MVYNQAVISKKFNFNIYYLDRPSLITYPEIREIQTAMKDIIYNGDNKK